MMKITCDGGFEHFYAKQKSSGLKAKHGNERRLTVLNLKVTLKCYPSASALQQCASPCQTHSDERHLCL